MLKSIHLNLPVESVSASVAFFSDLGFGFDAKFSGDDSVCLILGENLRAMLVSREKFAAFIDKPIAPRETTEAILSFECKSAELVRTLSEKAIALGARKVNDLEDHGFMVSWGFEDLDGHLWDLFWFNPAHKG
jgi:predicted lactoylglutathione lyase